MLRRKVILIVILSLGLLGTSALPSRADELGDAVQQQKDIANQKNQSRGQLNQLTYTADKIKTQMAQLETQIAAAQMLLGQKQAASAEAQKQVLSAQKELDLKQKELEDRRVALGKRAKGIYESGQVSYLELLFQSADLGDFITRMEYFTKLVSNDRQLLMDIQTQKEQIAQKTHELQSKRDQAAQLQVQAASVSADLDKAKSQQHEALDQNQKAQQAAFENIDRLESEANAWNDKIRKLQAAQAGRNGGVNGSISTWPVPGYYEISSPFGWRIHPITQKRSLHTGTDIVASSGTKITAAGAGVVIMAGWNTAYGNMTIIDHGKGISTLYGHQSALNVTEGQSVQANQVIGYVGSTGWSTGAHLHFEVRVGGNPTDPLQYFPN
ncbi:MAG TPA: peptidoglycan DD-metalloendopeptidase family protein [Desulfosporosinus sp.]|nr:peptidoglycan DD-metalloendopeptidase family protein [Desulfosporosinus sp.]